ncbi:hypothetical protein ZZ1p0068 [Acinetobacter phage ZZ1]|uniref:ADP-ribosyl transferase n=1 Tax=Acinetobacter phage ZZ1 TaxID=1049283 RepID=W0B4R3_9CAUD|nr:hypothetical protein ZZ1p0068 [Acinetobacter phage ZZ1]AHE63459.1 hypothetical protein ZZ1p0068 [Acinetobacter phage ZZ1]
MVNLFPAEVKVFYHGSSSACGIENMLLPPIVSDTLSEKGRNKNLDRVFFTADLGLAKVYAGRACNQFGGEPKIYRVVCPVDMVCMNDTKGASVYHAAWSFVEEI